MSEQMTPFEERLGDALRSHVDDARLDRRAEDVVSDVVSPSPARAGLASPLLGRLATVLAGAAAVLLLVVVVPRLGLAPGGLETPTPAAGSPSVTPPADPERLTWFERVALSADRTVASLEFTGGPPYDPADHCSVEYATSAEIVGDELRIALWDIPRPPPPPPFACPAEGYPRELEISLERPFTGNVVRDLAGYIHFLDRPPDLAELDLPRGWSLLEEGVVGQSPTGRWRQVYMRAGRAEGLLGRLTFYQAFNGPASVDGVDRQPPVQVNSQPATLWRWHAEGELVLSWRLGPHGLALVAHEDDFSVEELVALAASARLPGAATPTPDPTASPPPSPTITPEPPPPTPTPPVEPTEDAARCRDEGVSILDRQGLVAGCRTWLIDVRPWDEFPEDSATRAVNPGSDPHVFDFIWDAPDREWCPPAQVTLELNALSDGTGPAIVAIDESAHIGNCEHPTYQMRGVRLTLRRPLSAEHVIVLRGREYRDSEFVDHPNVDTGGLAVQTAGVKGSVGLEFRAAQPTYRRGQQVELQAELVYQPDSDAPPAARAPTLHGSLAAYGFVFEQLDGDAVIWDDQLPRCEPIDLSRPAVIEGGAQLPPGRWRISVTAEFSLDDCGGERFRLSPYVYVTVD